MNQEVKWIKYLTRNMGLYKLDVYFGGLIKALKKHFNFNYDNFLSYVQGEEIKIYVGEDDLKGFGELIKNHFLENIRLNKDPFAPLDKISKDLVKSAKEISNRPISSRAELFKAYSELIEKMHDYQIMIWFPVMCEIELYPYAKNRLMQLTSDEKAWGITAEPFEPSAIQQEFIDLLKVAVNFSEEKLQEHQKKYTWMSMRFMDYTPYDINHFRERLKEIKNPKQELERIEKELKEKKKRFYDLLDSLNLSKQDRELFIVVNRLNYIRNTRDNFRRVAYYHAKSLYDKILAVLDCDYPTLLSHREKDVAKALENGIKLTGIYQPETYIHMWKYGNFELVTENVKKRLEKEGIKTLKLENIKEFKGTVACQGKVTGKAKIITLNNWAKDCAAVQKGDILVAISTKPDYIVAMERAAAFVTDEGGITAHAAIVAREMGKPCIVGTNIATQVLKNGEMVEVDAEKGIVRKIK